MNYTELVQMYAELASKGFQILAFPCNQFGAQEPGTNQQIFDWAKSTYNVTFPMFEKIEVNGDGACDVYKYLRKNSSELNDGAIPWNFAKFLVDGDGKVVKYNVHRVKPSEMRA